MDKSKNKTKTIVILTLFAILLLLIGIFAYSKYTTKITGSASTSVAKWNFGTTTVLTGLDLAKTSGATIFDTVHNVTADRIAPGTSGNFAISLNTTGSEVAVQYTILLSNIANKPTNLHFYSDAAHTHQIDTTTSATFTGYVAQADVATAHSVTIYWAWPYQTGTTANEIALNDGKDTTDGQAAKSVTFDLAITGTQVDPSLTQVTTTAN